MRAVLEQLLERRDLSQNQATELLVGLTDEAVAPPLAGAVLAALRAKGETAEEIRGFAVGMRGLARRPALEPGEPLVDIVGTGGDGSGSLNLSTGAALLAAAAGLRVVKHGNRSVSSRCGSADVLEELGLRLPLDEQRAGTVLQETGFTFLFAPYYHPAMGALAAVRRSLGIRTVFNVLGPLTNPAEPAHLLVGAFDVPAAQLMAETLSGLPIRRAFVVHGEPGWDEPTPVGPFVRFDVRPGQVRREERDPADYGLPRCTPGALLGGDAAQNAARLRAVLRGEAGPQRDALVLGAALALELAGVADSPRAATAAASAAIDDGRAGVLLDRIDALGRGSDA